MHNPRHKPKAQELLADTLTAIKPWTIVGFSEQHPDNTSVLQPSSEQGQICSPGLWYGTGRQQRHLNIQPARGEEELGQMVKVIICP